MKLLALTFLFIGLTTANFNPGLGGNTGSVLPNKVGGPWIGQNCLPPEWIHIIHDPDYRCDTGLECHCKVIIDTPTYKKKKCSCQLPGSQSQLGNATTIAIRKEQGQWKLADGKKFESTEGNPTEMEGSYGTTDANNTANALIGEFKVSTNGDYWECLTRKNFPDYRPIVECFSKTTRNSRSQVHIVKLSVSQNEVLVTNERTAKTIKGHFTGNEIDFGIFKWIKLSSRIKIEFVCMSKICKTINGENNSKQNTICFENLLKRPRFMGCVNLCGKMFATGGYWRHMCEERCKLTMTSNKFCPIGLPLATTTKSLLGGINPSMHENKSFYGWGLFKTILKGCVNKVSNCQRQVQVGKEHGVDYCNHHEDIIRTFFRQNCRKSCGMC